MKKLALASCLIFFQSVAYADADCKTPVFADSQKTIALYGKLKIETHWGPPSFGDDPAHDSKFDVVIIELKNDLLVNYKFHDKRLENNVREIQLFNYADKNNPNFEKDKIENLVGKLVAVTGELWSSVTPGDVEPTFLAVTNMDASDNFDLKSSCRQR